MTTLSVRAAEACGDDAAVQGVETSAYGRSIKGGEIGIKALASGRLPVRCWIRRPWCWWTVGSTPTSLGRVRVGRAL